ncbi:MAG: RNA polymerase sigma factor [Pseudomonadota bacterium]
MKPNQQFKQRLTELLPRLYRYARVLTPTRFDADDLLQMTCERALSRWHQLNLDGPMDRWAFTIMSSVWKNELRSRAIRQGQGFVAPELLESEDDESIQRNIYLRQVLERVSQLPETQRETVLLVYVEGFTYQQAADVMAIPIGTVMSRLTRARQTLSKSLKSGGNIDEQESLA